MNDEYKISFCIPCYNVEQYIEQCVNSIEMQDLAFQDISYEILLVNDVSTDNTLGKLQKIATSNQHCKIFTFEYNSGISAVRNFAIQHAKGKYIWFVDGDDMLYPHSCAKMFSFAEQYNADKCFGNYFECKNPEAEQSRAEQSRVLQSIMEKT